MPPKIQALPGPEGGFVARDGSTLRRARRLHALPRVGRILGIDPGLHRTGYGMIELRIADCGLRIGSTKNPQSAVNNPQLIEGGVLKAKATDPLPQRLQTLYDSLCEVLHEHAPEVVVVEEMFSTYAHPRSALLMAQARGVLLLAAQQSNVAVHSFLPNEVKQVLTGNGHATKSAMQAAVRSRLRLAAVPEPPDVADALALALCFAARQSVGQRLGG